MIGHLRRAVIATGVILIAVVLVRLLQLQLNGLQLQAVLQGGSDTFIDAEPQWGRVEAERLIRLLVGLVLLLGGVLVLRPRRPA